MSSDIAIKVENLSKHYQIYAHPKDRLKQSIYPKLKRLISKNPTNYFHEFKALDNISFEVKKGETVGIIGKNGSGKSTLLQLICGTLNPTSGTIQTHGRIAALLELGSGFNPEFTGKENVYLNASILGLTHDEIDSAYSDIEAFADIGEFINQPIKTYSSGMVVRLAFAVIAHVNADILVIDEALAVGDAIFTQKCMRFIRNFKTNRTLLFVSHDINSVINLCDHAIWINQGIIQSKGKSADIAEIYQQFTLQQIYGDTVKLIPQGDNKKAANQLRIDSKSDTLKITNYQSQYEVIDNIKQSNGFTTDLAKIVKISLTSVDNPVKTVFEGGELVELSIEAFVKIPLKNPILGFLVRDRLGQDLFGENTLPLTAINPCDVNAYNFLNGVFQFNLPFLPNGEYSISSSVADGDLYNNIQHNWINNALILKVSSNKIRWGLVGLQFENISLNYSFVEKPNL